MNIPVDANIIPATRITIPNLLLTILIRSNIIPRGAIIMLNRFHTAKIIRGGIIEGPGESILLGMAIPHGSMFQWDPDNPHCNGELCNQADLQSLLIGTEK